MKTIVTKKLGIDWDKFVKQVADPAKQTNSWLDKINVKAGRIWNILDNKLSNIEREVRDGLRPLKNIIPAASGISETVSSPTLYMAGEKGTERVNITPGNQTPQISMAPMTLNFQLGDDVKTAMIKFIPDLTKEGHMKIHASAVKDW